MQIPDYSTWVFTDLLNAFADLKSIAFRDWQETYKLWDITAEINRRCPAQKAEDA